MLIFFLLFILSYAPQHLTYTPIAFYHRRILHQPFFPLENSTPPPPPPQPKFLSSTNAPPFFPNSPPSPPSPPASSLPTFPANISSLSIPHYPSKKPISPKIVISILLPILFLALFVAFAIFFYRRRRKLAEKSSRSDSNRLFPANGAVSNGHKVSVPGTSSEFLYLGTMVNSHRVDGEGNSGNAAGNSPYRKLGSPQLHPLPPLAGRHFLRNYGNATGLGSEEEEEFYSPRGSSGSKESLSRTGSSSRRVIPVVGMEKSDGRSSDSSRSYWPSVESEKHNHIQETRYMRSNLTSTTPSNSSSPLPSNCPSPDFSSSQHSSNSPSMPTRISPERPNSKSPTSPTNGIAGDVGFLPPPPPPPPPPPRSMIPSSPKREPPSPIEKELNKIAVSERIPNISSKIQESTMRIGDLPKHPSLNLPPPAPPPPPAGFWDTPNPPPPTRCPGFRPPVLVTPSRTIESKNQVVVSPDEVMENSDSVERNEETPRPKLKPLHWDKVRASSDREMVWDQLKSSSFQLNEEMIETLFLCNATNSATKEATGRPVLPSSNQENRVLDPKKSQNIAILLRALNVTKEEVCEALLQGNIDSLGVDLLETLLKMAPTKEEELKLKEYKDDSPVKLGPAERFLKAVLDIPFAFKRIDAMLYIVNFDSEIKYLSKSFETLEAACEELRSSWMFLKLLEAVLKTGNRMNVGTNRGDAHAFKLDTLLKLVDVKGTDGKTTLLHFVVQEIIRSEGSRVSSSNQIPPAGKSNQPNFRDDIEFRKRGLQVVAGLSGELSNVKKAATMDSDVLCSYVSKLAGGVGKIAEVMRLNDVSSSQESSRKFSHAMSEFLKKAEEEIIRIQAQESVALSLVKEITEYFHGNSAKEEAHPFRIFMVVRDFLSVLDRVCKEVGMINERTIVSSARQFPVPVNPMLPSAFPRFHAQLPDSSDDEDSSL